MALLLFTRESDNSGMARSYLPFEAALDFFTGDLLRLQHVLSCCCDGPRGEPWPGRGDSGRLLIRPLVLRGTSPVVSEEDLGFLLKFFSVAASFVLPCCTIVDTFFLDRGETLRLHGLFNPELARTNLSDFSKDWDLCRGEGGGTEQSINERFMVPASL